MHGVLLRASNVCQCPPRKSLEPGRADHYVAKDALISVHDRGNETTLPDLSCNCQSSLLKAENAGAIVAVFCAAILSARIFALMESTSERGPAYDDRLVAFIKIAV
jgi:hypothetical protein